MGDGESSTSRGRRETVVIDHGRRQGSCGYCRSTGFTSISHGLWALSITADDYQELLDRGWRRSGSFLYKPDMENTCCPSYTIRVKGDDFVLSKEQVRVNKKVQRFLDGTIDVKKPDQVKEMTDSSKGLVNLAGDSSSATETGLSTREPLGSINENMSNQDEFVHYLSTKIDDAISSGITNGKFPCSVQVPKSVVKRVILQPKRKLTEILEDLLYTSNIAFQIAAALRKSQLADAQIDTLSSTDGDRELVGITPNIIAEKLALLLSQHEVPYGILIRACNGHLNFYSSTKQQSNSMLPTTGSCTQNLKGTGSHSKRSSVKDVRIYQPQKRRSLEIVMKRSSFDPEEFALYKKYQIKVHGDKPEKVTESSYKRFLVDTPIIFVPPCSGNNSIPPCGFGSFHQQYLIDGKLVAVGVVDILPRCLSSKYLFWDPDFAILSLGKYSALQEISWINETRVHCPSLQYYYLGYYIHSCNKMRYKAAYWPSELLCPLRYKWVPFDIAKPLLDKKSYVVLSDFVAEDYQVSLSGIAGTSSYPAPRVFVQSESPLDRDDLNPRVFVHSESHLDRDDLNEDSSDDEETNMDCDVSDMWLDDDGSGPESCNTSIIDNPHVADISNIMIDLNGTRVKFEDLQEVFGPIEKRHVRELEMQLQRYVKVVGTELSTHIVYSLG